MSPHPLWLQVVLVGGVRPHVSPHLLPASSEALTWSVAHTVRPSLNVQHNGSWQGRKKGCFTEELRRDAPINNDIKWTGFRGRTRAIRVHLPVSDVGWLGADKRHDVYWIFVMEAQRIGIESWLRTQTMWTQPILETATLSNLQGMSHQRKLWLEVRIVGTVVLGLTILKCNLCCEEQAHFTQ